MWTFENPPLSYLEKECGFKPDQGWLNSFRLGSLRLGGEDVAHRVAKELTGKSLTNISELKGWGGIGARPILQDEKPDSRQS